MSSSKRMAVIDAARIVVNTPAIALKHEGRPCLLLPHAEMMELAAALAEFDAFRSRQIEAAKLQADGTPLDGEKK